MPAAALRIALGGFHIESSTFTPYLSDTSDFFVLRGDELRERYPWIGGRDESMTDEIAWLPLVHARALPGGIVRRDCYDAWEEEFLRGLRTLSDAGPLDGVLLDLHGAATAEGDEDLEGALAARVRETVGPGTFVATSMDLHDNVSAELFGACDFLTCYRTAPHVDAPETRRRAAQVMVRVLRGETPALHRARVAVPILLPGEKTSTSVEPGRGLYAQIAAEVADPAVADVAIWMGFPWADQARCHGVVVATATDPAKAQAAAGRMAARFWAAAPDFTFVGPAASVAEAVDRALASTDAPFFLSDTGDNPGAGGTGDSQALLRALFARYDETGSRKRVLFASLFSPDTVQRARAAGVGGGVDLGGEDLPPLRWTVESEFDDPMGGPSVVLRVREFRVIVTSRRIQYSTADAFARAGQPMTAQDIVAVKIGYLEPDLAAAQRGWVMALSPGSVDQDLPRLPFRHLTRPLVPFDAPDFQPDLTPTTASWPRL